MFSHVSPFLPPRRTSSLIDAVSVLQVDLLKSTSLPLMKRFGVDGDAFVVKVRVCGVTPGSCHFHIFFEEKTLLVHYFWVVTSFAVSSGVEEGYGTWGRRRGLLFMSCLQVPQTSPADGPRKDQADQRSGVSVP